MITRACTWLRFLTVAWLLVCATAAEAHPHVWTSVKTAAEKDAADAQRLVEAFLNQLGGANFGGGVANPVSIRCPGQ